MNESRAVGRCDQAQRGNAETADIGAFRVSQREAHESVIGRGAVDERPQRNAGHRSQNLNEQAPPQEEEAEVQSNTCPLTTIMTQLHISHTGTIPNTPQMLDLNVVPQDEEKVMHAEEEPSLVLSLTCTSALATSPQQVASRIKFIFQ